MSSEKLIEAFEKAGIKPARITIIKETKADIQRHKDVENWLKEVDKWEKESKKCNMVFK